jgi:hypothetical protein
MAALNELKERLRFSGNPYNWSSDTPPAALYHYTGADGALGILSSGEIWATDALFVSDSKELRYGQDVLLQTWNDFRQTKEQSKVMDFIGTLVEVMCGDLAKIYSAYLACFCEAPDLLSQWRAYGQTGVRFAIGLDTLKLRTQGIFKLVQAVYDAGVQRGLVESEFKMLADTLTHEELVDKNILPLYEAIEPDLLSLIAAFKHPAFYEEREWRLVYLHNAQKVAPGLNFRVIRGRIVPYVPVRFGDANPTSLPIISVTLGPGAETAIDKHSIKEILKRCGTPHQVALLSSAAPYRG